MYNGNPSMDFGDFKSIAPHMIFQAVLMVAIILCGWLVAVNFALLIGWVILTVGNAAAYTVREKSDDRSTFGLFIVGLMAFVVESILAIFIILLALNWFGLI